MKSDYEQIDFISMCSDMWNYNLKKQDYKNVI